MLKIQEAALGEQHSKFNELDENKSSNGEETKILLSSEKKKNEET